MADHHAMVGVAPDAINRPCHHDIEGAALRLLEQIVQAWAILAALGP
jgi:hypothetical protein